MRIHERTGAALPLVVLLLLALTLLGYGALAVGTAERAAARAGADQLRTRLVAEGAARSIHRLPTDSLDAGLWSWRRIDGGEIGGIRFRREALALGGEWWVVRGWARVDASVPPHAEARVGWSLDPVARLGDRAAVLAHGGDLTVAEDGELSGSDMDAEGTGAPPNACAPYRRVVDSLFPGDRLPSARRMSGDELPDGGVPLLGLLGTEDLEGRLDPVTPGSITPVPVMRLGRCQDVPSNWGSPTDPSGPCGARRVGAYVAGDLTLEGGEGQGVLVVDGHLRMEGDALFAGLVLAGDSLTLTDDARLLGAASVRGPVRVGARGRIDGRACSILLGLADRLALRDLVHPRTGSWIRPF